MALHRTAFSPLRYVKAAVYAGVSGKFMKENISIKTGEYWNDTSPMSEEKKLDVLEEMASGIGKIIIEFNSLEETIHELILHLSCSPEDYDDRINVFLAEMMYGAKVTALTKLYGQVIEENGLTLQKELARLENRLRECSKVRNQYAHANWGEISKFNYVKVKLSSQKQGIEKKYRRFTLDVMQEDLNAITEVHAEIIHFDRKLDEAY